MINRTTKDTAKSLRTKLFNLSKKEQLNYQMLIIHYVHERLLYRLSVSRYKDKFYLKGGALLYAAAHQHARPTLDIDFMGDCINNDKECIRQAFSDICSIVCEADALTFDTSSIRVEEINENHIYQGIRLSVTAFFDTIRQPLYMDIGFGDVITPAPEEIAYPVLLSELPTVQILAYSLETVVAEKFQAMIELAEANSRFKDFYDIYKILVYHQPDKKRLAEAVKATFSNRHTVYFEGHTLFTNTFMQDEERQNGWKRFLKKIDQKEELPFASVMEIIKQELFPIWEQLKEE